MVETISYLTHLQLGEPKRRYVKAFISKIVDVMGEEAETEVWVDMSKDLKYISIQEHQEFIDEYGEVARMFGGMLKNPQKFCH